MGVQIPRLPPFNFMIDIMNYHKFLSKYPKLQYFITFLSFLIDIVIFVILCGLLIIDLILLTASVINGLIIHIIGFTIVMFILIFCIMNMIIDSGIDSI